MEKERVICNKCGKELKSENGILHEDGLFVTKDWGYFSKKDMQVHKFTLCESCYDRMAGEFKVPVVTEEKKAVLD